MGDLRTFAWSQLFAGLLCASGCYEGDRANAGGSDESSGTGDVAESGDESSGESGEVPPEDQAVPAPSRHWRLTWAQYDRAMSELVGADVQPSVDLDFPRELEGFAGWLNQSSSLEASDGIATAFEDAAVLHAPAIAASLPACGPSEDACIDDLVRTFGKRAWRRPVTDAEVERYAGLFTDVAGDLDTTAATESVVEAMIRSPFFVFRSEVGDEQNMQGEYVALTQHEIASALSFALWGAPPDAMLLAAADDGTLDTADAREAHARRMLDDPRFIAEFYPFLSQWLGFYDVTSETKDATLFPEFDASTASAMEIETRRFVEALLKKDALTYQALLTTNTSFPPAELDWIYGIATTGEKIETPERMGILLQPSFLATHAGAVGTSPTKRGVFVTRRMTCFEPPRPPDDAVAMNPEPDPNATTRELFERHSKDPGCASCHLYFDPIGMAFEAFDAVGRFRTHENGLPVDASGLLQAGVLDDEEVAVDDARDLVQALADSPVAQECFVRKTFQYFHGREDLEADEPLIAAATEAFTAADYDIRELLVAFIRRPEFVLRRPTP